MTVATYKGGRGGTKPKEQVTSSNTRVAPRRTTCLPKPAFDDQLPEGVDFSEGGWATDFALSLLGLLFFISAVTRYDDNYDSYEDNHFAFLFAGTAVAHCFGGLAHRFFPNRAADGEGQVGFYVCMVIGYAGNCLRYGLGWGLHLDDGKETYLWLPIFALANWLYLVVTSTWTVCRMRRTDQRLDDSPQGAGFLPDTLYAAGELVVALLEMITGILFLKEQEENDGSLSALLVVAVASNIVGWFAVYAVGGCATLFGRKYDPSLMQRQFHYALMVMLWAINEYETIRRD